MKIEWVSGDLPISHKTKHDAFRDELRTHPGVWAKFPTATFNVTAMRAGKVWRGFEWRDVRGVLYVRFVGVDTQEPR